MTQWMDYHVYSPCSKPYLKNGQSQSLVQGAQTGSKSFATPKMDRDYTKYLSYHKIIDTLIYRSGLWHHFEDKISPYRLIIIYGLVISNIIGMKAFSAVISSYGNVSVCLQAVQNTIAIYAPMSRMISYLWYRQEFVFLDKELGAKFKEELENEENRPTLLKNISLYNKFLYFFIASVGIAIFLYWAPFAILNFKYKKSVHIMPGSYPFPVEPRSSLYWAIFFYETTMFWFTFHSLVGVDSAFGMHCFRISSLIRLTAERFRDLDPNDPKSKDRLQQCVATHQLLIRAKLALQKAYGVLIIFTYLISAVVICTVLWEFNQMKSQLAVSKIIYFACYMTLKLVQTFIYAYYGSAITAESENCQDAIYTSNWPGSGNLTLMKDFYLILMQRPVVLKACGFFYIDMHFFEKICNTSISYFFLIQSLDSKE